MDKMGLMANYYMSLPILGGPIGNTDPKLVANFSPSERKRTSEIMKAVLKDFPLLYTFGEFDSSLVNPLTNITKFAAAIIKHEQFIQPRQLDYEAGMAMFGRKITISYEGVPRQLFISAAMGSMPGFAHGYLEVSIRTMDTIRNGLQTFVDGTPILSAQTPDETEYCFDELQDLINEFTTSSQNDRRRQRNRIRNKERRKRKKNQ